LVKDQAYFAANEGQPRRRCAVLVAGHEPMLADAHFAGLKRLEPVEAAKKRAFSAAGRSDNGRDFALRHRERNPPQHLERPVALVQVDGFDHRLHGER
jgi:hypothetical protein